MSRILFALLGLMLIPVSLLAQKDSLGTIVDEVIWVVGDEAILKSDVEALRIQGQQEGMHWKGDPDCSIPEQIAVQKLYLNQAIIDSVEVTEAEITQGVEQYIENMISMIGSREKLEEYQKKSLSQIRADLRESYRERQMVQGMQQKLVKNIAVTPAEVRRYFKDMPQDSLPFVPTEVEVQIITLQPRVAQEEINRIKEELREYTDRVTKGETTFQTLARMYSEDPGTARRGGELDYTPRAALDPAFANVAFSLTDPKRVSKIVESEFGYHIIQLIDKRGDKVKCRHILKRPEVAQADIDSALVVLDSMKIDILDGKISFEDAARYASDDKDSRNNHGIVSNINRETGETSTRFEMSELSALSSELARTVESLEVGEISKPFTMINTKGKTVCAIARLKNRTLTHRASITEDFQVMQDIVKNKKGEETILNWIKEKQKSTYIRINPDWRDCEFQYEGWVK